MADKVRVTEIVSMECGAGPCPSAHKTSRGTYFIVGRQLSPDEVSELLPVHIGEGEAAVEIPQALVEIVADEAD